MFGRIFGRGKDETDQAVCAQCGRTLLAGEWTQKVVDADGNERLICSLCGQTQALSGAEPVASGPVPVNDGRVRESRAEVQSPATTAPSAAAGAYDLPAPVREPRPEAHSDSDAFWRALKEKDAEIERLQAQLARSEAEKEELAGRLALAQGAAAPAGAAVVAAQAATAESPEKPASAAAAPSAVGGVPAEPLVPAAGGSASAAAPAPQPAGTQAAGPRRTGDASEPGERTWGETPAEFAAELAAIREEEAVLARQTQAAEPASAASESLAAPAGGSEPEGGAGGPIDASAPPQTTGPALPAVVFEDTQPIPALTDAQVAEDHAGAPAAATHGTAEVESTLTPEPAAAQESARREPTAAELEAEAASLTLLQRGVDLLNVSRVPRKIAETNEQLGIPAVHVGFDGRVTAVIFMWTMGWYRFEVDSGSGDVRMADRGYDELVDVRPNASVRVDGTVQLAPAQISRAAVQHAPADALSEPAPALEAPGGPTEPEPPSVAAQKPPEILSKSLLGQRSDDEAASWEKTQARDFDWDR